MKIQEVLKRKRIFTLQELIQLLSCSAITGRRRLKEWGAHRSYNRNGSYYALPSVPDFDRNGLWSFKGVLFSVHGDLRDTVRKLIQSSVAGLTTAELGEILGLDARKFISHFRNEELFIREPRGREFIWFYREEPVYRNQKENRRKEEEDRLPPFSEAETVVVLAELIRHPDADSCQLCELLRPSLPEVSPGAVEKLLGNLGILKKTVDSKS